MSRAFHLQFVGELFTVVGARREVAEEGFAGLGCLRSFAGPHHRQLAGRRRANELREARWLLKERDEFLARTQREADEIIEVARGQASRMVQKTEVVREAQMFAQRTVDRANDEAARLRNEAEDYCDQKLAQFEIVLQRTLKTVHVGREKLQVTPLPEARAGDIDYSADAETTVFDQDLDA